ncbi:MAG: hypothetical protein HRT89_20015 [Lentisphaeria bacterium]|nr:hypothetical protein [Lentisphaeria bacterium]
MNLFLIIGLIVLIFIWLVWVSRFSLHCKAAIVAVKEKDGNVDDTFIAFSGGNFGAYHRTKVLEFTNGICSVLVISEYRRGGLFEGESKHIVKVDKTYNILGIEVVEFSNEEKENG